MSLDSTVDDFVKKTIELLQLERDAEIQTTEAAQGSLSETEMQKRGICLRKLVVSSSSTGLGGRSLVKFEGSKAVQGLTEEGRLPAHRFSSGDIVKVSPSAPKGQQQVPIQKNDSDLQPATGVILRVSPTKITVAFDDFPDDLLSSGHTFSLFMMANEVTHNRMKEALETLRNIEGRDANQILSVMFGGHEARFDRQTTVEHIYNSGLNSSQRDAISFAMSARDVALIHGPPGTGKTTTVVELIIQLVSRGNRVLACAGSNVAVDNIVEKLSHWIHSEKQLKGKKFLRIGHPARLLPQVVEHSLDARIANDEGSDIVKDVRKEMNDIIRKMSKSRDKGERYRMRSDLSSLRRELVQREKRVIREIVGTSDVILTTNVGAADRHIQDMEFDVVIIDEAAQTIEASCWIPILKLKRGGTIILAGDPCQLGPTIKSEEAAKKGLQITLFDRLQSHHKNITRMLEVQYRMHEDIMTWPSRRLYDNRLTAHESNARHLLKDLPSVSTQTDTLSHVPLLFIDTAGCSYPEAEGADGESKSNENEAMLVKNHVEQLLHLGLREEQIAVISPYNAQVSMVKKFVSLKVEVGSVDGFQGREKEAIIISFVRSNEKGQIGFLSEDRRTNVALTRARRHLTVIGDSETLSVSPFLKDLIEYMYDKGQCVGGVDYMESSLPFLVQQNEGGEGGEVKTQSDVLSQLLGGKDTVTKKREPKKKEKKKQVKVEEKREKKEGKISESQDPSSLPTHLDETIEKFRTSDDITLTLPSSLNAFERRYIHELCERYSLGHQSKGEGENRHLVITKTEEKREAEERREEEKREREEVIKTEAAPLRVKKSSNLFENLKEEAIEEEEKEEEKRMEVEEREEETKEREKRAKEQLIEKKKVEAAKKVEKEENFLLKAMQANKECNFGHCTRPLSLINNTCQFCGKKFCASHVQAEVHGCGDAAKKKARGEWMKNGKAVVTGAPQKKPLKQEDRKVLSKILNKKVIA
ncbi:DNA-binding protein SMUBP-2 [Planoprotostelium fungivorum]|uniref:DNA-binding protein SMUBP-2 n=1 Tax=Planoprotostelium fungivorum TaxID=1890364 RepID=A0A2P6MTS5_9EUKA|nr:DNA-binding protein SMUBP-2 [Planoprotostelium fungivorum]